MSRYRVLLLLFVIAAIGALNSGRGLWWGMAGALFALLLISVLWAWTGVNWLRVGRKTNTRIAQAGQMLEEEFRLNNLSIVPKLWVEIRDFSTLPAHFASRVLGLIGGSQWRGWRTRTRCAQRGRYQLGPIEVRSGDPLGIYQMTRKINIVNTLLVYPATYDFRDFPLPLTYLTGGDALRRRTHYITTNAAGVRDYVIGDSINRIHWPSTARRGRLIVKEFELDPMSDLWIAVDLFANAHVNKPTEKDIFEDPDKSFELPPTTEEYCVSIAASVARHFLQQERALGFIAYGKHRHVLNSERGERQFTKIMETLSVVHADGAIPFDRMLSSETVVLPRGATIVAISPSLDPAWAAAIGAAVRSGLRVVAIFVDSRTFGAEKSSEEIISALAESGAILRIVRKGEPINVAIEK